jgi:hypothetical protein
MARTPTTVTAASTQKSIARACTPLSLAVGYNEIGTHGRRSCNNAVAILAKDKAPIPYSPPGAYRSPSRFSSKHMAVGIRMSLKDTTVWTFTTFKGEGVRFGRGRAFWSPLLGAAFALPRPDCLSLLAAVPCRRALFRGAA